MYYKEYIPRKELKPFIRSYFHVRLEPDNEIRFPSDGCPGLIVNLGDLFLLGTNENDLMVFSGCRLFGYLTRRLMIKSLSGGEALAVKFMPGQLAPFSKVPGIDLTDTSISIENLWGAMGRDIVNRIYDTGSILDIVKLLDVFFLKLLSIHDPIDTRISSTLGEILKRKGQVRIINLANWTNLSRRQFERCFTKTVGLPPKRMCRIARISGIISQLKTGQKNSWANVAFDGGYSDQAHLIREWKYFTGSSPQSYLDKILPFESAVVGLY